MNAHARAPLLRPTSSSPAMISDQALDLIIETMIGTTDPYQRSVIVHNLVQELQAIVSWLARDESGSGFEVLSVSQVLTAACEHRRRMEQQRAGARAPE